MLSDIDYSQTHYRCDVGRVCPSGFVCSDQGLCVTNPGPPDGGDGPPGAGVCTPGGTNDTCVGSTLHQCRSDGSGFDDVSCGLGCATMPTAHCKEIVPSGAVTPPDLDPSGLGTVTIATSTTLHSDTGAIDGVRPANTNPDAVEIQNGIRFHIASGVGIFSFGGLTIADGSTLTLVGPNPVALVSSGSLNVIGVIDARGTCSGTAAGPGGFPGGAASSNGQGQGGGFTPAGTVNDGRAPGGGGAGYGENGGNGGDDNTSGSGTSPGGVHGTIYGTASLVPLRGGSGGGAGYLSTGGSGTTSGGTGGGGGGAVQLVAAQSITIGGGTSAGGVNAGGCGGAGGATTSCPGGAGGGGGGAGGAILVESQNIHVSSNGALAANGGGGGGGSDRNSGAPGQPGKLSLSAASGGAGGTSSANGGAGGVGGAIAGQLGGHNTNCYGSGGGGGGVGRILLNSTSGSATIDSGAILSPRLADTNSQGAAVATQGTITIQ